MEESEHLLTDTDRLAIDIPGIPAKIPERNRRCASQDCLTLCFPHIVQKVSSRKRCAPANQVFHAPRADRSLNMKHRFWHSMFDQR